MLPSAALPRPPLVGGQACTLCAALITLATRPHQASHLCRPQPALTTRAGQKLDTLNDNQTITVAKSGSTVSFVPSLAGAPRANVVKADIKACQAIIHVIDQVGMGRRLVLHCLNGGGCRQLCYGWEGEAACAAFPRGGACKQCVLCCAGSFCCTCCAIFS